MLKSNNSISLKNILDYADKYSTSITLKRILKNLSELDSMQQTERISEYNNLVAEIGKEKITLGKSLNYILSGVGFIPIIGTGASIASLFLQLLEDSGVKRKMVKKKLSQVPRQLLRKFICWINLVGLQRFPCNKTYYCNKLLKS